MRWKPQATALSCAAILSGDEDAACDGDIRVIDETGEDYLYPASYFVVIEVPQEVERAILHAS